MTPYADLLAKLGAPRPAPGPLGTPPPAGAALGAPPMTLGGQTPQDRADESAGEAGYDVAKDPAWKAIPAAHESDHAEFLNGLKPEVRAMVLKLLLSSMLGGAKGAAGAHPKPPPEDPNFAHQGTVTFAHPDAQFGDSYTDARARAAAVARQLANSGAVVGSEGPGMWTVKQPAPPRRP